MKKMTLITCLCAVTLFPGCDFIKSKLSKKEPETQVTETPEMKDFSCTAPANVEQLQNYLKDEYLKQVERNLRGSHYEADRALLDKITPQIKFEIKGITTLTEEKDNSKILSCESNVIAILPKGLFKRAENAYIEMPCDEECPDYDNASALQDYLEKLGAEIDVQGERIKKDFRYSITKTDQDGLQLSINDHSDSVSSIAAEITQYAVEYASYVNENQNREERIQEYNEEQHAQRELAQKAINIRKKELTAEKVQVVNRLNQTWENFNDEQKAQLQQDQSDWFEKRDVDCKLLS